MSYEDVFGVSAFTNLFYALTFCMAVLVLTYCNSIPLQRLISSPHQLDPPMCYSVTLQKKIHATPDAMVGS